jgi:hypothetical protein
MGTSGKHKRGAMPDIMIRCPRHGVTSSTGLSTDTVVFETLPDCVIPLRRQACNETHVWRPAEAFVPGPSRRQNGHM